VTAAFAIFATAVRAGAPEVEERPSDPRRSFLEATLDAAIARYLPGRAQTAQQRRRFPLQGFDPYPYGVDIDWVHDDTHAGVETKVSDVLDSLFDMGAAPLEGPPEARDLGVFGV
jgi:hypothetical protein